MMYELDDVERRVVLGGTSTSTSTPHTRALVHVERGTPSQVVHGWDTLAKQERRPS